MDAGSRQYLTRLADAIYNDALDYDKAGDELMCTAMLELSKAVMTELHALAENR